MTDKQMPFTVKFIVIIYSLILAAVILSVFSAATGLTSNVHANDLFKILTRNLLSIKNLLVYAWILIMILSILGFVRAKPFARNLNIAFYGFAILYFVDLLLDLFIITKPPSPTLRWAYVLSTMFLSGLIFLLYLSLRPEVYDYCRPEDSSSR